MAPSEKTSHEDLVLCGSANGESQLCQAWEERTRRRLLLGDKSVLEANSGEVAPLSWENTQWTRKVCASQCRSLASLVRTEGPAPHLRGQHAMTHTSHLQLSQGPLCVGSELETCLFSDGGTKKATEALILL